ncbi:hypothetical protein T4D_16984 [Trichinella pseudospiralis]|uniref:Uncharacterized protein n=1 Tax=Trichinella pseudospiralis TaxID=6337 RepID=A0A0V1CIU6_TRIPS|nr:hypothetical protein T4D_16984 [Trichinella pseudospiralis]
MRFTRNVLQLFLIDMKNTAFRVCRQSINPLEKKL